MAEIVLDVHDSIFEADLRCEFDVVPLDKLLKQEMEKFKKAHPELYARLENDLKKLEELKSG